jgi:DNA-binding beta-propeller fold protein YncE
MSKVLKFAGLAALLFVIAGCATTQPTVEKEAAVFFPPPPSLPRIQFLKSYEGAKDIEEKKSAFETFVTGEKESQRILDKPYGVAIYHGKIYVCDTNSTVMVFDMQKKTFEPLQGAKGQGKLIQPLNISIDSQGNKYVTDPIRQQVVIFDKNDFYVKALGGPGDWKPVDAVYYDGLVYVADIKNGEIRVFDKGTGEIVRTFGRKDKPENQLVLPVNLAFDSKGYLYVVDAGRFQVVKFDRDGHLINTLGSLGTNLGHFGRPRGIAIDKNDNVYVVDASFYNVQMFNSKGQLLMFFGEGGTNPGKLILPAGIAVDYDSIKYFDKYADPNFQPQYLLAVVSQFGNRPVNIFAYGKEKGVKYPTYEELLKQSQEIIKKREKEEPPVKEGGEKEQK